MTACRRGRSVLTVALLGLALASCGQATRPNLVFVSVDTLRADHLGAYGYGRRTSPHLDRFRREAVLFERSFAHSSSTLPSHATFFTSLLPSQHQASHTMGKRLPPEAVTLAEVLSGHGYRTRAVTDGAQMAAGYGLAQGFERYLDRDHQRLSATVREGLAQLAGLPEPFFLFLHTYEVHHPYRPRADLFAPFEIGCGSALPANIEVDFLWSAIVAGRPFPAADVRHIVNAYDAEIRSMDEGFGDLVAGLRAMGLYDRTLIVFVSDHGEELGEHGRVGWHGHSLYDELLRVPLLMKLPASSQGGRTVEAEFGGIDLAPTVLQVLGVPSPAAFGGRGRRECLAGPCSGSGPLVLQGEPIPKVRPIVTGIRAGGWKLQGDQLFALRADPAERWDVAAENPEIVAGLRRQMADLSRARPTLQVRPAEVDAEVAERLRSLGYVR